MEFAIVAGVITMFASGLGIALTKRPIQELGTIETIVWRNFIAVPILLLAFLAYGEPVDFSRGSILAGLGIAVAGYFPFMFFMFGLQRGKVGVITSIASGRIFVSALFGFWFLGEVFSAGKLVAFSIICLGILASTVNWKDLTDSSHYNFKSGAPFALIGALMWGVTLPLFKFPSEWYGAIFFALVVELAVLIVAILHLMVLRRPIVPHKRFSVVRKNLPYLIGGGMLTAIFTTFTNLGYETGEISIVTALSGAAVIVAILASAVMYRERLSPGQYAGALLVVVGIAAGAIL